MQTFIIEAMTSANLGNSKVSLTLSDMQIGQLRYILETITTTSCHTAKSREYFFEKEGYMESDEICLNYFNKHNE